MSEKLVSRIFEPRPALSEPPIDNHHLIVLPNDIAGGLADALGIRAQAIADATSVAVLAYERPHSTENTGLRFSLQRRHDYRAHMRQRRAETADRLSHEVELANQSARILMVGASAAASEVIGVAAESKDKLPVTAIAAADPPGLRHSWPLIGEVVEYGGYHLLQEHRRSGGSVSEKAPMPSRLAMLRTLGNVVTFSANWRLPETLENMRHIAKSQPDVAATIVLPGHTFTAKPALQAEIATELNGIRTDGQAKFEVRLDPDGYHSDYGNPYRLAELVHEYLPIGA